MGHTPRPEPDSVILVASRVTRSIGGTVLRDGFSFEIKSGEIVFLQGPSGVGKTSLLRVLALLDPVESGSIELNGETGAAWGVPRWRTLVHYCHQQRIPFPGSPKEVFDRLRVLSAQKDRQHGDFPAILRDLGLEEEVLTKPLSQLSGGQAQRVQIALGIALNPRVLLLDEPTSALDGESARLVEAALKRCGAALVWVSHDTTQSGRVGGRVITLPEGTVEEV